MIGAFGSLPQSWRLLHLKSPLGKLYGSVVESDNDVLGVAWDLDKRTADIRALGEGIERSALHLAPDDVVSGTAKNLGDRAFLLGDRVRFSDAQIRTDFRLAAFDWGEDSETTWTTMRSRVGEKTLVPVDLARIRVAGADPVRPKPMTSIGTACGDDWDSALGRALLEIVERHAVAIAVYKGAKARLVDPLKSGVADIVGELGGQAKILTAVLPERCFGMVVAIVAVCGTEPGLPQAAFGTAASINPMLAIRSAALEAVHVFHLGWRLLRRGTPLADATTINQRALWWATNGGAHLDMFFRRGTQGGSGVVSVHDQESYDSVVDSIASELERSGHRWAFADITPPWAGETVVARVVAPSLLHLQINEFPFLVAPRFPDVVGGYFDTARERSGVPHPFV